MVVTGGVGVCADANTGARKSTAANAARRNVEQAPRTVGVVVVFFMVGGVVVLLTADGEGETAVVASPAVGATRFGHEKRDAFYSVPIRAHKISPYYLTLSMRPGGALGSTLSIISLVLRNFLHFGTDSSLFTQN
jgi:hypothetical protein